MIVLRLSIPRSKIGMLVMKKGKEGFTTLLPREDSVQVQSQRYHGHRWRLGQLLPGRYPSVVLEGDDSVGEFYSVALMNNYQQADTGTKMIHKGKNTRSRIISKGISAAHSRNVYRGLVQVLSKANNARNSSQCDSMLIGDKAAANTYPCIQVKNPTAHIEHEASTSIIGEDQLFYVQQRGIGYERAMAAMISDFYIDVFYELPDEFGAEVTQLMSLKLGRISWLDTFCICLKNYPNPVNSLQSLWVRVLHCST